ncbi:MAG TPA: hypothetical protein VF771_02990, partial [Longimicrobiaceae bacterium]
AGARLAVRVAAPPAGGDRVPEPYRRLRAKVEAHPGGAELLAAVERHREEIVHLVNHRRPVALAWHRARGPALLATLLNTIRAGGEEIPAAVDGVASDAALERMIVALAAHGSPALRTAIDEWRAALLEAVRGSADLDQALEKLDAAAPGRMAAATERQPLAVGSGR